MTAVPLSRIGEVYGTAVNGRELPSAELWAVSPFTRFARLLCKRMTWWKAIASSAVAFTFAPLAAFWTWFVADRHDFHTPPGLLPMMILASSWILLGPVIMIMAEVVFASTLGEILRTENDGWDIKQINSATKKINQSAISVVSAFVILVIVAYLTTFRWLQHHLALGDWHSLSSICGLVVITQIGVASGYGIWQAIKSIVFVRSATQLRRNEMGEEFLPPWRPLRPRQAPGIEALGFFAIFTAVGFSFGSTLAPSILIVAFHTSLPASFFLYFAVTSLMLGSTVLFLIPATLVHLLAKRQEDAALQELALKIEADERLLAQGKLDANRSAQMSVWLSLRREFRQETAHPESVMILRRLPAAMFIPAITLAAAFISSGGTR